MKEQLQAEVIKAAIAVCENAAFLPDGNAQIPTEIAENLGEALVALADYEEKEYKPFLKGEQKGLNPAQVALQRLNMDGDRLKIERLIDLGDKIYLGFFDEVEIPGALYRSLPVSKTGEVRFINKSLIEGFQLLQKS